MNEPYQRVPPEGYLAIHIETPDPASDWIDVYVRMDADDALSIAYTGPERDLQDLVTRPPRGNYLQLLAANEAGMQICGIVGERVYWPLGYVDVRGNFGPMQVRRNCLSPQGDVPLWALELDWSPEEVSDEP